MKKKTKEKKKYNMLIDRGILGLTRSVGSYEIGPVDSGAAYSLVMFKNFIDRMLEGKKQRCLVFSFLDGYTADDDSDPILKIEIRESVSEDDPKYQQYLELKKYFE